ncbi:glycerol-3-phosphate dehydrogenase [Acididesulfobacillus acetoxydans]|uniref:glycerol-3-phosphate dehydrogenase n=1 Tax=Acididesulfobacillus acetoxydans TaxID=1561005 RepID=A0A8S0W2E3_9FIRM|nr:anaerobic glycerol-3-phosphate dehydrogenase subunit GlpA [Acididesulfobacillus acetoxydans]CAA7600648.1 glycerol-3-phosphate dehydrogenase [Acididesulfobacillus acetoxydans]CEJ09429.1 Anaerobic glycerol-3-phosphate dehydrogenase subunit A [Acididesulfobacillus acetoxydans]
MVRYSAQVVIIGGGATGVGILRDLSLRGISSILVEQGDLAHGTSSRFHGLLHSGARYAVKDPVSAAECIRENNILKQIAPECVAATGGWFVQLPGDEVDYAQAWLKGCERTGIPVHEVPLEEALKREPLLAKEALRVFEVPDAAVDGFKLVWENAKSARRCGGRYLTYHRVEAILREGEGVAGVRGENLLTGESFTVEAGMVVNATGAWADRLAASAGASLEVVRDKGILLAFNHRLFQRVINRLRPPGDGDIFVPHETITILGTTSEWVDTPSDNQPSDREVERMMTLGKALLPGIAEKRVIRAFAGVRPLHRSDSEWAEGSEGGRVEEGRGRAVSRTFALIDHEAEEGIKGFLSIVGGKFTTYRLMAEKASDWVAAKLANDVPCRTAAEPLQPELPAHLRRRARALLPCAAAEKTLQRLGRDAAAVLETIARDPDKGQLLCECEMVTVAEVEKTVADEDAHHLADVRRKTRLGMGTCQGAFCTYRALPLMWREGEKYDPLSGELIRFLNQRWKGIRPVLWGDQLRETELTRAIYAGLLDLREGGAAG